MVTKRARLTLKGKVQGVFFRDFAKQNANKLGLGGYAKNLRNGNLEIVVQGEESKIKQYIQLCRGGPIFAKVEGVDIEYIDPEEDKSDEGSTFFDIRPT